MVANSSFIFPDFLKIKLAESEGVRAKEMGKGVTEKGDVLVHLGCHNPTDWLHFKQHISFSQLGSMRSRPWQMRHLRRAHFLAHRGLSSPHALTQCENQGINRIREGCTLMSRSPPGALIS